MSQDERSRVDGIYLAHETHARSEWARRSERDPEEHLDLPEDIRAEIYAQWEEMSPEQRREIVLAIRRAKSWRKYATDQTEAHSRAISKDGIEDLKRSQHSYDLETFYRKIMAIDAVYDNLLNIWERCAEAEWALFRLKKELPRADYTSLHFSSVDRDDALTQCTRMRKRQLLDDDFPDLAIPKDRAGRLRMPEILLPRKIPDLRPRNDAQNIGSIAQQAIGDSNNGTRLVFAGKSSNHDVFFMKEQDQSGNVIGRAALKVKYLTQGEWLDMRTWAQGSVGGKERSRISWELECQRLLSEISQLQSVVKLHTHDANAVRRWIDGSAKLYRVYICWCDYQDLEALIDEYVKLNKKRDPKTSRIIIPEPMIWYVAESLALCGLEMEKMSKKWDGKEIVHRDLKPDNVFLARQQEDFYEDYPSPQVGDFGSAIGTSKDDLWNPSDWNEQTSRCCQEGYRPPEMMNFVDYAAKASISGPRISSKTNVWQAGGVLRCLVTLDDRLIQAIWLGDGAADTTYSLDVGPWRDNASDYSKELRTFITDCMQYDPDRRPSFDALLKRITAATHPETEGSHHRDLSRGMKTMQAEQDERETLLLVGRYNPWAAPLGGN